MKPSNIISFGLNSIIKIFFGFLSFIFIPKNKNIFVFGDKEAKSFNNQKDRKEKFIDNTKAFFLYLSGIDTSIKVIYLCDDVNMVNHFNKNGFMNIYTRKSFKGIYYTLRAKYWFYDHNPENISNLIYPFGVTCINFWHGIPLKRVADDEIRNKTKINIFKNKIAKILTKQDNKFIVNSKYEINCFKTAFKLKEEKFEITGSPRLDSLLNYLPKSEIFMEEDFENVKKMSKNGKKIIVYMPTFRDSEKDISGWLKSEKLKQFLKDNNSILVCKLHPLDINSLNFDLSEEFYKMEKNSDIYPVLKYSDALITDYSSVYFDYLLLDKPIIYYPIDLEEYEAERGFYRPYEELTAGAKAYNEEELISELEKVMNGKDDYKKQRKTLRDKMFVYQDGRNCERVADWIKELK